MKTEQIRDALRKEYTRQDSAIVFEVPNGLASGPNNSGARTFADAIVCNMWRSRGFEMEGIEVKVARSDWQRELQMPRKAEGHFERCDRWWLVTPHNSVPIAKPDEIPGPWGWMMVTAAGELKVVKKAPKLVPARPFDLEFAFALVRAASRFDRRAIDAEVRRLTEERDGTFSQRVNARAQQLAADQVGSNPEDRKILDSLRLAFGGSLSWLSDSRVVEAIQAVRKLSTGQGSRTLTSYANALNLASEAADAACAAAAELDGFLEGGSLPALKPTKAK